MPVTRFACPSTAPSFGEMHTPEFCITKCKNRCLSPFLIAALTASAKKNHHKGRYISATALSGCVRKLKLERTVDYAEEFKNLLYAFRGTITHTVVEEAAELHLFEDKTLIDLGFISEWHMAIGFCFKHGGFALPSDIVVRDETTWDKLKCPHGKKCECFILGGTLDGLEPHWDQFDAESGTLLMTLHDLKTMQQYAVGAFITGDKKATLHSHVKDDYVRQAQIYRYLCERSDPPEILKAQGVKQIKVFESRIQAFAMGEFPYTGAKYNYKSNWKAGVKEYEIPTISFLTDKWVEDYIKENALPIYESLITNKSEGAVCAPDSNSYGLHSWRCNFCAFHGSEFCEDPKKEWKDSTGTSNSE